MRMPAIRRAVWELLDASDRDAIPYSSLREALGEMLSADSQVGRQTPLDYHTPRKSSDRMADLMADPQVRRRMLDTIERGVEMGGETFYDTRPMRAMWEDALPTEEADPAFRDFMGVNAAMSPQSNVPSQIKRAILLYGRNRRDEILPYDMPEGYGHLLYKTNHRRLANNVLDGKGLSPRTGAKTASFRENLLGNLHDEVATIDKHATALPAIFSADPRWLKTGGEPVQYQGEDFVPRREFEAGSLDIDDALEQPNWWGGKPRDNEYRDFVSYYGGLGREAGLNSPAATQAAAWRGGDHITGVESPDASLVEMFADRVKELADRYGLSFREALRTVARGDRELLSIAAGAPMLLALVAGEGSEAA